jgi:hypothetical protein
VVGLVTSSNWSRLLQYWFEWSVSIALRGHIFIRLLPAVARRRAIQWASGLTYLSADLITPVALWEVPKNLFGHFPDFIKNDMHVISSSPYASLFPPVYQLKDSYGSCYEWHVARDYSSLILAIYFHK